MTNTLDIDFFCFNHNITKSLITKIFIHKNIYIYADIKYNLPFTDINEIYICNLENLQEINIYELVRLNITLHINNLEKLKTCKISNTNINIIQMIELPKLETLIFEKNTIKQLDETFFIQFNELKTLQFINNTLFNKLPEINLSKLYNLQLQFNNLSILPDMNLRELTVLLVFDNDLTELTGIDLQNLLTLHAYNNRLTTLTGLQFPNLKHLLLKNNLLTTIDISEFPKLEYLDMDNNILTEVINYNASSELTTLYLQNNKFTNIPKLTNLIKLIKIILSHNSLTSCDHNNLPLNLENLHLENNNLREIPNLGNFDKLTELNLSRIGLATLINWDILPPNVEILDLSHNNFSEIPMHFKRVFLKKLVMHDTKIKNIPTNFFKEHIHLKYLDLSNNKSLKFEGIFDSRRENDVLIIKINNSKEKILNLKVFTNLKWIVLIWDNDNLKFRKKDNENIDNEIEFLNNNGSFYNNEIYINKHINQIFKEILSLSDETKFSLLSLLQNKQKIIDNITEIFKDKNKIAYDYNTLYTVRHASIVNADINDDNKNTYFNSFNKMYFPNNNTVLNIDFIHMQYHSYINNIYLRLKYLFHIYTSTLVVSDYPVWYLNLSYLLSLIKNNKIIKSVSIDPFIPPETIEFLEKKYLKYKNKYIYNKTH